MTGSLPRRRGAIGIPLAVALRRILCNLRPGWHPGFHSEAIVLPHNFGVSREPVIHWTRPRCVFCGELE